MNTQEKIRHAVEQVYKAEETMAFLLKKIQAKCTHPSLNKKYDGNTGNYDPTADEYWIDFHCPDCDKRWREEQR